MPSGNARGECAGGSGGPKSADAAARHGPIPLGRRMFETGRRNEQPRRRRGDDHDLRRYGSFPAGRQPGRLVCGKPKTAYRKL